MIPQPIVGWWHPKKFAQFSVRFSRGDGQTAVKLKFQKFEH